MDLFLTFLDLFGAIWSFLEPYEVILTKFDLIGVVLSHLDPFGLILEPVEAIWNHFELFKAI